MWFVIAGVIVIVLNLAGVEPFGAWTWNLTGDLWKFAVPFVCAALWWIWADKTGMNRRREMERMEAKKQARRDENLVALGMGDRVKRKSRR